MAKRKIITFAPIIALATLIAVSLQLDGMFMMWKIQQVMQDYAIHRLFKCFEMILNCGLWTMDYGP